MRESYAGMKYQALKATLEQRRKAILVSLQVCKTWLDKFTKPAQRVLKRPAAVSASSVPLVETTCWLRWQIRLGVTISCRLLDRSGIQLGAFQETTFPV